jgi:hypothetical protein
MGSVTIARAAVTTANKADVIASPSKVTVKVVKWALRPITMNASAKERPGRNGTYNYIWGAGYFKRKHSQRTMTLRVGRRDMAENWLDFIFNNAMLQAENGSEGATG